ARGGLHGPARGPGSRAASPSRGWPWGGPARPPTCSAAGGRQLLDRLALPEPWAGTNAAAGALVDDPDAQIAGCEPELRRLGADHPSVPLLMTVPGIAWVLGSTIAAELGDISRFATPKKLAGYTGLLPRAHHSGARDHRGPLSKNGPRYLRWALLEAATHAAPHPCYADQYQRHKTRLRRQA